MWNTINWPRRWIFLRPYNRTSIYIWVGNTRRLAARRLSRNPLSSKNGIRRIDGEQEAKDVGRICGRDQSYKGSSIQILLWVWEKTRKGLIFLSHVTMLVYPLMRFVKKLKSGSPEQQKIARCREEGPSRKRRLQCKRRKKFQPRRLSPLPRQGAGKLWKSERGGPQE